MKNIVLASLLGFGLISSAWATETVNIHERVNNAQAPAHQMQSAAAPVGIHVTNGAIVIHTQRLKSDPGGNLLS
ncbi:Silver-binding protein SilE [Escherichia coli]|nr:Silver-binding protein SilE [Escherichia coli]